MRLSPLFGTAMVAVVLGLLAIPLHRLTGSPRAVPPPPRPAIEGENSPATPSLARIRLLREATMLELAADNTTLLWKSENVPAGETEVDIPLEIIDSEAVLHLRATFTGDGADTAVFVTVLPDGLEERTSHAIGAGTIEERLVFTWPHP